MTDARSLDEELIAFLDRRALLAGLGLAAALAATAMVGAGALAQEAKPKEVKPEDVKPQEVKPAAPASAPRRRGISGPDGGASRSSKPFSDEDRVPGGLPGSAPTPDDPRVPGGLPGAR